MSINVGFLNSDYSLDKFSTIDNRLIINSYNDCNIILLNHDDGSHTESLINYKNIYATGIKNDRYVIHSITCNVDLFGIEPNILFLNTPLTIFNRDVEIKSLLKTHDNVIDINSNLNVNLYTSNDYLKIRSFYNLDSPDPLVSNNFELFSVGNDAIRLQLNSNNMIITHDDINFNGDLYIRSNVLYANAIKNIGQQVLEIHNPYLIGLQIESSVFYNYIHIQNDQVYDTKPTLQISRYYNPQNIIDISTCNLGENTQPIKNFIIDKDGYVGIGSVQPTAPLSISRTTPIIMEYNGLNLGDKFTITEHSDVGIGTTDPKHQLHIIRGDDLEQNDIRNKPLFGMTIYYEEASNIITSNFKTTTLDVFPLESNVYVSNMNVEEFVTCNLTSNNVLFDFYTTETKIINEETVLVPYITSNYVLLNNFNIFNTDMYNGIENISNAILANTEEFLTIANNTFEVDDFNTYIIYNKIFYPNILYGSEVINDFAYSCNVNGSNTFYNYKYGYLLGTSNTNIIGYINDSNLAGYNGYNFEIINLKETIQTINNFVYVNYDFNIYFEKGNYIVDYIDTRPKLQPPPYFLYTTSNNTFISSLSSFGTFSLGKESPIDNTYLLYAPGYSRLDLIETNEIKSIDDMSNISFSYCNLININLIDSCSNITKFFETDFASIKDLNVSNIFINSQDSVSINTSNISFTSLNSDYINVTSNNFHINIPFSVAVNELSKQLDNTALIKITLDSNIISNNNFYKHNKGIILTNEQNVGDIIVNPTISIIGNDLSEPYFHLQNNTSEYFMRITSNIYSYNVNEWSDVFEICCDTITCNTIRGNYYNLKQPHLFQHIKKFNMLTLGENNTMCIDILDRVSISSNLQPVTNSTNKITIGLPMGILDNNATIYSDWPQYLHNTIINGNDPYMLNIYGNVNMSSIHGKPIFKAKVDNGTVKNAAQEVVNISINGEPTNKTLHVYGEGMFECNLYTSNSFYGYGPSYFSDTLTVQKKIFAIDGVLTVSDRNIKEDLQVITNSLDKICSLTGYTFTRKDTGKRETGLIAQDVKKVLPEVINDDNNLLTISYGNLAGIIVESIKELKEKINKLEDFVYT